MRIPASLSTRLSGNSLLRWVVAVLSIGATILICNGLERFIGIGGCYVLLVLSVAFTSWYCGIGPAALSVCLGIGATFLSGFRSASKFEIGPVVTFAIASGIVILLGEYRRRHNALLLKAQSALEERVLERTKDLDRVNRNLRELSARLMQLQDDERRRIARELHDSVGQTLAALAMNLAMVRNDVERLTKTVATLNDSEGLIRDMSSEVRTISHLLHPPLLDEAGLSSAIRWYVDGFAQRSQVDVDLDLPEDFERLPAEMETAIFRVVQECLTNIHRHSGSPVAKIQARQRHDEVVVEIADKGKGIPPEKQEQIATTGTPGVGVRGMRERIRQLGGTVEIKSSGNGTCVTVKLPVPAHPHNEITVAGPAAA
jgi:signal transduction histidine kinase